MIAPADPQHEHHARARRWFFSDPPWPWATCPFTENGFIRILGHPSYPDFAGGTAAAATVLARMCLAPGHQFWPDAGTLRDLPAGSLPGPRQLTNVYLLALAVHRRGQLATLDAKIATAGVPGGEGALLLIP